MFWKTLAAFFLILATVCASATICVSGPKNGEILVSAAISLKDAFEEIASIYEKRTGVRALLNLGASGLLLKQIEAGAPVDVFASAGEKQMDELQSRGLILADTRRNFARNALVLIVPTHTTLPIHGFADLRRPGVTRIAVGNPKTVPAGEYAREALRTMKLWDALQPRLILAENVRQVLDYVERGETDAGIVYASDLMAAHGKATIAAYAPDESHSPILYPIAVVRDTGNRSDARRFIDLTLSAEGQAILKKYGFLGSP
jgi:molybdate transport system substrate-binding protein